MSITDQVKLMLANRTPTYDVVNYLIYQRNMGRSEAEILVKDLTI